MSLSSANTVRARADAQIRLALSAGAAGQHERAIGHVGREARLIHPETSAQILALAREQLAARRSRATLKGARTRSARSST